MRLRHFLVPLLLLLSACGGDYSGGSATGGSTGNSGGGNSGGGSGGGSDGGGNPPPELPLLGSSHARSFMTDYCEGKPDAAVLPQDPRELIRPSFNAGRAVAFNVWWEDCTGASGNPNTKPKTCGEYRSQKAAGERLMRSELALNIGSAEQYNQLWLRWGLPGRPADFDAQLRERYGLPEANFRNPYPLPGEDAAASNGGSGQLPAGITQLKDAGGRYSGNLGITCDLCHSGELKALGDAPADSFISGLGAHGADGQLALADLLVPLIPFALNSTRGVTNAMGLSGFLVALVDFDSVDFDPATAATKLALMQLPGNTSGGGDTKMPAWWNASHRPRKFWDAGYSYDALRMDNVILQVLLPVTNPGPGGGKKLRDLEPHAVATQTYLESLTSPPYPGEIDTALAEAGAILFHAKDLWANGANAHIPRPPGNGSCAGCHGAYSPRYANDPAYLADARVAGMAGYLAPLEQIRTDPARLEGFTAPLFEILGTGWLSYPEGAPGYVAPEDKNPLQEAADDYLIFTPGARPRGACQWQGGRPGDPTGYLTPPLHGVWATAPYLHNGSVPDVWSLLKPSERPALWRRQLNDGVGAERGFDTRWQAYDEARMGWKHDVLTCGAGANGLPYYHCQPAGAPSLFGQLAEQLFGFFGTQNSLGYQTLPPLGRQGVEDRKIFNTYLFGKSNSGHDFTEVLTDAERRALIEYLKTL
jgi:endo-cleaving rubber dioxygenase